MTASSELLLLRLAQHELDESLMDLADLQRVAAHITRRPARRRDR